MPIVYDVTLTLLVLGGMGKSDWLVFGDVGGLFRIKCVVRGRPFPTGRNMLCNDKLPLIRVRLILARCQLSPSSMATLEAPETV